jgi:hypothetical protein
VLVNVTSLWETLATMSRPRNARSFAERWIKDGLQHLKQRLLDEPIRHHRDAKLALAFIRFWGSLPDTPAEAGTCQTAVVPESQAIGCWLWCK